VCLKRGGNPVTSERAARCGGGGFGVAQRRGFAYS